MRIKTIDNGLASEFTILGFRFCARKVNALVNRNATNAKRIVATLLKKQKCLLDSYKDSDNRDQSVPKNSDRKVSKSRIRWCNFAAYKKLAAPGHFSFFNLLRAQH